MFTIFLDLETEIARDFQYDYIFFDAILLAFWILFVIKKKKIFPLKASIVTAAITYFIDAVIWWNTPSSIPGVNIREYRIWDIFGVELDPSSGIFILAKFGADFMMTISYSLFAFTWVFIMFESWKNRNKRDMMVYSLFIFSAWMIVPWLSKLIPLYDARVWCIRHMDTQIVAQIVTVIAGFVLMSVLYGTSRFNSKDPKVILYVFLVGCFQGFIMEFPLWISGIRPTGLDLLIYETIILANQGAPYLYVIWDKILPLLKSWNEKRKK